jgi:LacI family transcriptional regulator
MSGVIINHLKKKGYNVLLSDTMESESNENQVIGSFVSRNVDAIIVVPVGSSSSYLESVAETVPVVLIDRYFENTKLPYVCTDNYIGSYMAAEYLIDKGYRNILAIQGVQSSMPNKERVRGFRRAVADHESEGVRETIIGDSFSVDNGYTQAMAALSLEGPRPDAIFAFSTTILLGVIKAVRDLGLKIPDDVAIISFDNNRFLDFLNPSITRIEQPVNLVGKLVVDCITQLIDGDDEDPSTPLQTLLRPTLIEGKSC